jgi:hypothetical protein
MLRQIDDLAADMHFRPTSNQSPEHWSKDFVEHLRTVHFALLAVSVGLILLLSSKSYDLKSAASQMTAVVRMSNQSYLASYEFTETPRGANSPKMFKPVVKNDDSIAYSSWFSAKSIPAKSTTAVSFHLAAPNLYECTVDNRFPGIESYHHPDVITTINQFRIWWDNLLQPAQFLSVVRIGKIGRSSYHGLLEDPDPHTGKLPIGEAFLTINSVGPPSSLDAIQLSIKSMCRTSDGDRDWERGWKGQPVALSGTGGDFYYEFPVTEWSAGYIGQRDLVIAFPSAVKAGRFEESFPDLAKATNGREEMDFTTLAPQIYAEAAKDEAFEAFGVKFPSEQVTRWGIIVLTSVQLYLVMYLKRLSNKLKPSDPGWDTPWMAMDPSRLARTMLFISVAVLPLSSALFVCVRAAQSVVQSQVSSIGDKAQFILICCGGAISMVLCCLSWKYRPNLRESVASAQFFE